MTLGELKKQIAEMEEKSPKKLDDYEIFIIASNGGFVDMYPSTPATVIFEGTNLNAGKIFIRPKKSMYLDI